MIIEVDDLEMEALAHDIYENYPEYSSPSLRCTAWNYGGMTFHFDEDDETGTLKKHVIRKKDIMKGLQMFIQAKLKGELPGIPMADLFDAGEYDAVAVDAVTQFAIFGEVIYG